MKILVVTHFYSTHAGGIELVAGTLAAQLARSHDVTWAASDCDPLPGDDAGIRFLPMRSLNAIERITGLPFPLWGPGSLIRLWRGCARADVVHLHDLVYFGNWAAFAFARLRGRPILVTQHAGLIRYPSAVLRAALGMMHRTIVSVLMRRATRVVFVSSIVREYFGGFVRFDRVPELVANGVNTDLYSPPEAGGRARARAELGFDSVQPIVAFVGRFIETKGLPTIERLARMLPDVTWLLAGWGPIDPAAWNASNVRVFTGLRGPTLVPLYRAADVLVLPSLGEGLPLVVQEALACGTRAIVDSETARAIGAPAGMVVAGPLGGPETADVWAGVVRGCIADRETWEGRRGEIAEFARARWSWPSTAARYSALFDAIVTAGGASSRAR